MQIHRSKIIAKCFLRPFNHQLKLYYCIKVIQEKNIQNQVFLSVSLPPCSVSTPPHFS